MATSRERREQLKARFVQWATGRHLGPAPSVLYEQLLQSPLGARILELEVEVFRLKKRKEVS